MLCRKTEVLLTVLKGATVFAGFTCFATVPANQLVLPYGASISAVEGAYEHLASLNVKWSPTDKK